MSQRLFRLFIFIFPAVLFSACSSVQPMTAQTKTSERLPATTVETIDNGTFKLTFLSYKSFNSSYGDGSTDITLAAASGERRDEGLLSCPYKFREEINTRFSLGYRDVWYNFDDEKSCLEAQKSMGKIAAGGKVIFTIDPVKLRVVGVLFIPNGDRQTDSSGR